PKAERRERAERYIKSVGLAGFENAMVHELSGGMKQRVGIARALVTKPDVILMDEPFGALDAQTRNIMQTELLRITDKTDTTVIFVTHSVDEAVYISDRIVVLTKRPAKIKEVIDIPWTHPRDRSSQEFTALRRKILKMLESENIQPDGSTGTVA
ncbi:MAG: ABC transporter ATP-binding protein, partial [Candidatus Methanomethylophilaceae archaeon]|nr:ABC transporter ATP-binding protein [Candidatus Methanomethylophilaceae archaeon]